MKKEKIIKILTMLVIIVCLLAITISIYYKKNEETIVETKEEIIEEAIEETKQIEEMKYFLTKKFELGLKLIAMHPDIFIIEDRPSITETTEEGLTFGYYRIINYEKERDFYFTENGREYLDKKGICLVWKNNLPYLAEGGGGKSVFGKIDFENIKVKDDIIEADAIMTMIDSDYEFPEYLGKAKSKFRLIKENNIWKIDEFADPDDFEKWKEI